MNKNFLKGKVTLLVLCNVDAKSVVGTARSNILDRLNDFNKSLPIWLNKSYFKNIIIIENSDYKGDLFDEYINNSVNKENIELIVYDGQTYDRKLGKGYGWYDQINKVINESNYAKNSDIFVIVTGRYVIRNFDKIISNTKIPMMCNINSNLKYAFSPITIFPKSFIKNYLLPAISKTNDSMGKAMEHYQADALLRAIADGYEWQLPPEAPDLDVISAFSNKKYDRYLFHSQIIKYYSYLKKFIFEFKR